MYKSIFTEAGTALSYTYFLLFLLFLPLTIYYNKCEYILLHLLVKLDIFFNDQFGENHSHRFLLYFSNYYLTFKSYILFYIYYINL